VQPSEKHCQCNRNSSEIFRENLQREKGITNIDRVIYYLSRNEWD
jgi:hypothetical protein